MAKEIRTRRQKNIPRLLKEASKLRKELARLKRPKSRSYKIVAVLFCLNLLGCATIGPMVTTEEVRKAREELRVKALKYQFGQLGRVNNIGNRLVRSLPQEPDKKPSPYLGITYARINKYIRRLFDLKEEKGLVVVCVDEGSPAHAAGIEAGDVLLKVGSKRITTPDSIEIGIRRLEPGQTTTIKVIREGQRKDIPVRVEAMPISVRFHMVDSHEVNAGASPHSVIVTYGLVKFAQSDDEIAVILGHELAHIVRGHTSKSFGVGLFTGLATIGVAILAESTSPGSGEAVLRGGDFIGRAFNAKYSRDLEREADYFGLKYAHNAGYDIEAGADVWERFTIEVPESMVINFLNTHPTSPERMVRVRKAIDEIKGTHLADEEIVGEGLCEVPQIDPNQQDKEVLLER